MFWMPSAVTSVPGGHARAQASMIASPFSAGFYTTASVDRKSSR